MEEQNQVRPGYHSIWAWACPWHVSHTHLTTPWQGSPTPILHAGCFNSASGRSGLVSQSSRPWGGCPLNAGVQGDAECICRRRENPALELSGPEQVCGEQRGSGPETCVGKGAFLWPGMQSVVDTVWPRQGRKPGFQTSPQL